MPGVFDAVPTRRGCRRRRAGVVPVASRIVDEPVDRQGDECASGGVNAPWCGGGDHQGSMREPWQGDSVVPTRSSAALDAHPARPVPCWFGKIPRLSSAPATRTSRQGVIRALSQRPTVLVPQARDQPQHQPPSLSSIPHRENRDCGTVENLIKPHRQRSTSTLGAAAAAASSVVFTNSEHCRGHCVS